jgi:hypothetical protein
MLNELRIYDAMPGKLSALNNRFADHTVGLFKEHGMGIVGFWTDMIGTGSQLTYMLSFESMADREKKFAAFAADPRWLAVRAESEKDGPLAASIRNIMMRPTPYSPEPKTTSDIQELRIYEIMPGRMPAIHDRFANTLIPLCKKHGIEMIGCWTQDVGTNNHFVYMVGYPNLGEREKVWPPFYADSDWRNHFAESEKGGPIIRRTHSTVMRLTDYSPR